MEHNIFDFQKIYEELMVKLFIAFTIIILLAVNVFDKYFICY